MNYLQKTHVFLKNMRFFDALFSKIKLLFQNSFSSFKLIFMLLTKMLTKINKNQQKTMKFHAKSNFKMSWYQQFCVFLLPIPCQFLSQMRFGSLSYPGSTILSRMGEHKDCPPLRAGKVQTKFKFYNKISVNLTQFSRFICCCNQNFHINFFVFSS